MESFDRKDIDQLKTLHAFLSESFQGASIGQLKMNDAVKSLDLAIKVLDRIVA